MRHYWENYFETRASQAEYLEKNKEKIKMQQRKSYAARIEVMRMYDQFRYLSNPDRMKNYQKEYRERPGNKQKISATNKRYHRRPLIRAKALAAYKYRHDTASDGYVASQLRLPLDFLKNAPEAHGQIELKRAIILCHRALKEKPK